MAEIVTTKTILTMSEDWEIWYDELRAMTANESLASSLIQL